MCIIFIIKNIFLRLLCSILSYYRISEMWKYAYQKDKKKATEALKLSAQRVLTSVVFYISIPVCDQSGREWVIPLHVYGRSGWPRQECRWAGLVWQDRQTGTHPFLMQPVVCQDNECLGSPSDGDFYRFLWSSESTTWMKEVLKKVMEIQM